MMAVSAEADSNRRSVVSNSDELVNEKVSGTGLKRPGSPVDRRPGTCGRCPSRGVYACRNIHVLAWLLPNHFSCVLQRRDEFTKWGEEDE